MNELQNEWTKSENSTEKEGKREGDGPKGSSESQPKTPVEMTQVSINATTMIPATRRRKIKQNIDPQTNKQH